MNIVARSVLLFDMFLLLGRTILHLNGLLGSLSLIPHPDAAESGHESVLHGLLDGLIHWRTVLQEIVCETTLDNEGCNPSNVVVLILPYALDHRLGRLRIQRGLHHA